MGWSENWRRTRGESSWSTERERMAALARRWVGKGVSIVLRRAHELRSWFHRNAEAHKIHGNSSDAAMMGVTRTIDVLSRVVARSR
jgi:hypothetical protein